MHLSIVYCIYVAPENWSFVYFEENICLASQMHKYVKQFSVPTKNKTKNLTI